MYATFGGMVIVKDLDNIYKDNWARFYMLVVCDVIVFFASIFMLNIGIFIISLIVSVALVFMYRNNVRVEERDKELIENLIKTCDSSKKREKVKKSVKKTTTKKTSEDIELEYIKKRVRGQL